MRMAKSAYARVLLTPKQRSDWIGFTVQDPLYNNAGGDSAYARILKIPKLRCDFGFTPQDPLYNNKHSNHFVTRIVP